MTDESESPRASHPLAVRALAWALVLTWAGVIFWFSSKPGSQIPGRFSEYGHLGEYFVFGALLCWALGGEMSRSQAVALAIVIASLYGVTDEFHQHFVVGRTPDVVDWGVDTVGAALGALAASALASLAPRRAG